MRLICTACSRLRIASRATIGRDFHTTAIADESRKIRDLLAKFQDPESPYYIPPGTSGPAHEADHSTSRPSLSSILPSALKGSNEDAPKIQWRDPDASPASESVAGATEAIGAAVGEHEGLKSTQFRPSHERLQAGRKGAEAYFREKGFDTKGMLEWSVAWGDCDMFQHANNVNYVRWLESARLRWTETLADELSTQEVMNLMHGKGMGFILKEVSVRYRHPMTYPDTMLIANRPHSINPSRASFGMAHALWSLKDNKLAATADSTIVMYDYDHKRKGEMWEGFMRVLEKRSGEKRMA